jgi:hypothetical protein
MHSIDNVLYDLSEKYNITEQILNQKINIQSRRRDFWIFSASIIISALISIFTPYIDSLLFKQNSTEKIEQELERIIFLQQQYNGTFDLLNVKEHYIDKTNCKYDSLCKK